MAISLPHFTAFSKERIKASKEFTEGQVCPTDTASAGDQVGANKKSCLQEVSRFSVLLVGGFTEGQHHDVIPGERAVTTSPITRCLATPLPPGISCRVSQVLW
ncbi:unnamed protein product [Boreogadus saida]